MTALSPLHDNRFTNDPSPITILLVDDDPDCRMLLRDAISDCNISNAVYEVTNGAQALDFLYQRGPFAGAPRPGLIFLDIEMPEMDGHATLAAIRSDPTLRDVPVVMMTGVTDEAQMRRAAELGANSYTVKPTDAQQFLRTVLTSTRYWLTIHQYPQRHPPAAVDGE